MTDKELAIAERVLQENHINASPTAFWEDEKYYDIAYITCDDSTFRRRFLKHKR